MLAAACVIAIVIGDRVAAQNPPARGMRWSKAAPFPEPEEELYGTVVAGEFYEDAAPYRALAAAAGEGAVRLMDHYLPDDEVEALFKAADVVVLPYRSATQSGVTHVAYALGVPVIITDVGGLGETVRGEETGLVVPPENPEALAEAVLRFFADHWAPRLRAGVEAVQRAHSWDVLADEVIALGDQLEPGRGWR